MIELIVYFKFIAYLISVQSCKYCDMHTSSRLKYQIRNNVILLSKLFSADYGELRCNFTFRFFEVLDGPCASSPCLRGSCKPIFNTSLAGGNNITINWSSNFTYNISNNFTQMPGINITYTANPNVTYNAGVNVTHNTGVNVTYNNEVNITFHNDVNVTYNGVNVTYKGGTNVTYNSGVNITYNNDVNITYNNDVNTTYIIGANVTNINNSSVNITNTVSKKNVTYVCSCPLGYTGSLCETGKIEIGNNSDYQGSVLIEIHA